MCCECDRLLAEICGTSLRNVFSCVEAQLTGLKRRAHEGQDSWPGEDVLGPFRKIVMDQKANDVVTGIALTSIQRFIDSNIVLGVEAGDCVCEMLLACSFQTTSAYDCGLVFHRILSCMKSVCRNDMCSETSLGRMLDHVVDEVKVCEQNHRFDLIDTMMLLIECIFRQQGDGIKNKCILDMFYLAEAQAQQGHSTMENAGVCALIHVCRCASRDDDAFETLLVSVCVLVQKYCEASDETRDNFVLVLRLFYDVFSGCFSQYILPFAQCFDVLLEFILNTLEPVTWRQCALRVVEDFLALDHFLFTIYANLDHRPSFPGIFPKLIKVAFNTDLPLNLEVARLLVQPIDNAMELDVQTENQEHEKMCNFVQRFNEKPSQFSSADEYPPCEMARMLMVAPGLSRQSIGDFFGRNKEYCLQTLDCFLKLFDFAKLDFDSAIRTFLASFHIAGEGQIIDRIFGLFAKYFYESHKDSTEFSSVESVHVLSYGWLMLHTAIYNNNVAKKPSLDDFKKMLARQNDGNDFDPQMMETLYKSIKRSQIPVQDELQNKTLGCWRLMIQRQTTMDVHLISEATEGGSNIAFPLFQTVWERSSNFIFEHAEKEHTGAAYEYLTQCLQAAEKYQMTDVADQIVEKFTKFAMDDLAQDTATSSLEFLVSIVKGYGGLVRTAWSKFVQLMIAVYQLDLVPDESLCFTDLSNNSKDTVLRQRILSQRSRRNSTSMFMRFMVKRSASDESPRISVQSELREFVVKTNFHQLPSFTSTFSSEAVDALVQAISSCSKDMETSDSNALYIAYCALLVEKICEAVKRIPSSVCPYYSRLLNKNSSVFVQSLVINYVFMLLMTFVDMSLLDLVGNMEQKAIQDHFEQIERGLCSLVEQHLEQVVRQGQYKSVMKLLSCGLAVESESSRVVFDKLIDAINASDCPTRDFRDFWLPVVQMETSMLVSKQTPSVANHEMRLQTMLLSSYLEEQQWREVFNSVLFPALAYLTTRKERGTSAVTLVKIVMSAFLFALPKLVKSPLFESIWFRLLSLALELCKGESPEEVKEIFANALNVMKSSGAFINARQKMWQLTKSSIEAKFPNIINTVD